MFVPNGIHFPFAVFCFPFKLSGISSSLCLIHFLNNFRRFYSWLPAQSVFFLEYIKGELDF